MRQATDLLPVALLRQKIFRTLEADPASDALLAGDIPRAVAAVELELGAPVLDVTDRAETVSPPYGDGGEEVAHGPYTIPGVRWYQSIDKVEGWTDAAPRPRPPSVLLPKSAYRVDPVWEDEKKGISRLFLYPTDEENGWSQDVLCHGLRVTLNRGLQADHKCFPLVQTMAILAGKFEWFTWKDYPKPFYAFADEIKLPGS